MKRGLIARARTTRVTASASERGARPRRVGGVEHDEVGLAAERRHRRREAADEGDVRRAFEQVAAGIVAGMDQQVGAAATRSAKAPPAAAPSPSGAAEGMRAGLEIGAPELVARSSQAPLASSSSGPAP